MFSSGVLVEQRDLSLWRYDVTSGGIDEGVDTVI